MGEKILRMFWPAMPDREEVFSYIDYILYPKNGERPFIGEGAPVDEFEEACERKFGMDYVMATNSGSAALDLALISAGVGAGDEVITTPMTCTATNTPIILRQAKPVFADISYETANIDPKDIEKKITKNTKAIMVVHWSGYPCEMNEINEIAKKYNLTVIADGAHALGAKYNGEDISRAADYTMFSLQAIKQMTTIDGGLLAIHLKNTRRDIIELLHDRTQRTILRNNFGKIVDEYFKKNPLEKSIPEDFFAKEIFEKLEFMGLKLEFLTALKRDYVDFKKFWIDWQKAESTRRRRWFGIGRDERVASTEKGIYSAYPTFESGGKFHMNNLNAIIGLASLKKINDWQAKRQQIVERYNSELKNISGIKLLERKADRASGNWLYDIHVERRKDFATKMLANKIEVSVVHERNDILPIFRGNHGELPNLNRLNEDRICLPLHQNLTEEDVTYIIETIKKGW